MGEFGDKFRKAREKKNISLDDASNVTKIGARMLQAIEEEKFDQLPGGVFNKGFIRAYAKHLGINDEEAVTEYLVCLRQAQIEAQAVWEPPARVVAQPKRPVAHPTRQETKTPPSTHVEELSDLQLPRAEDVRPPRRPGDRDNGIPWRLVAAGLLVVVLGIMLWRRHSQINVDESPGAHETVQAAQPPTSEPAPASPTPAAQGATAVPANTSGAHAPSQASKAAAATSTPAPSPSGTDHPGGSAPAKTTTETPENDVTTRSLPATEAAAKAKPLSLVIRASENSWIAVTADGQNVSQETLIAPANTAVHANHEIVAKVGNAAGVSFVWNGKEIPAEGAESEVKTFIFDAQGMRVIQPNQPPAQNR